MRDHMDALRRENISLSGDMQRLCSEIVRVRLELP